MLPRIAPQADNSYLRVMEVLCSILYVISSICIGFALLILPLCSVWDDNYLLYSYPQLQPIVANSFFKGAVIGLGFVNILIGIQEIVRLGKAGKDGSHH